MDTGSGTPPPGSTAEHMERVHSECEWVLNEASEDDLRAYNAHLLEALRRIGTLTPQELAEAENPTFELPPGTELGRLRAVASDNWEWMATAFKRASGREDHSQSCRTSIAPAYRPGPCNCETAGSIWQTIYAARDDDADAGEQQPTVH